MQGYRARVLRACSDPCRASSTICIDFMQLTGLLQSLKHCQQLAAAVQECKAPEEVLVLACSVLVHAYSSLGRLVEALEEPCCGILCSSPDSPSSTTHFGQHAVPLLPCHWQDLGWADQSPQVGHTVLNVAAAGQTRRRWRKQRSPQGRSEHQPSRCHATNCHCPSAAAALTMAAPRLGTLSTRGPASVKEVGTASVTGEAQLA